MIGLHKGAEHWGVFDVQQILFFLQSSNNIYKQEIDSAGIYDPPKGSV